MATIIKTAKYGDFGRFYAGDFVKTASGKVEWKVLELLGTTHARIVSPNGTEKVVFKGHYKLG